MQMRGKYISANGKSNIYEKIKLCEDGVVLVIANGATFGLELERVLSLRKKDDI